MTQKPHVDRQENVHVNVRGSQTLARTPTTTIRGWVSKTRSVGGVKGAGSPEPTPGQRMGLEGAILCVRGAACCPQSQVPWWPRACPGLGPWRRLRGSLPG